MLRVPEFVAVAFHNYDQPQDRARKSPSSCLHQQQRLSCPQVRSCSPHHSCALLPRPARPTTSTTGSKRLEQRGTEKEGTRCKMTWTTCQSKRLLYRIFLHWARLRTLNQTGRCYCSQDYLNPRSLFPMTQFVSMECTNLKAALVIKRRHN
jgi:hypothetical protein